MNPSFALRKSVYRRIFCDEHRSLNIIPSDSAWGNKLCAKGHYAGAKIEFDCTAACRQKEN